MDATLTFDQMERSADRTLALVLWAKSIKNIALAAGGMVLLDQLTRSLVRGLSQKDKLASLSNDQAADLAKKLQELHSQLDFLLRRKTVVAWRTTFLFAASLESLTESTTDIGDIIEDLILSGNSEFRSMIVGCVQALPSHSAELVGHM